MQTKSPEQLIALTKEQLIAYAGKCHTEIDALRASKNKLLARVQQLEGFAEEFAVKRVDNANAR